MSSSAGCNHSLLQSKIAVNAEKAQQIELQTVQHNKDAHQHVFGMNIEDSTLLLLMLVQLPSDDPPPKLHLV